VVVAVCLNMPTQFNLQEWVYMVECQWVAPQEGVYMEAI
jgi:hypothetical protein